MNIFSIFFSILSPIFDFILLCISPLILLIFIIIFIIFYQYLYHKYVLGYKKIVKQNYYYFNYKNKTYFIDIPEKYRSKKANLFQNIFILFPKQLVYDKFTLNPNRFTKYGIHMIVGDQGTGKSILAAYLMQEWKREFPRLKIYTNMYYKYQNGQLNHWKDFIDNANGIYGTVNMIDEIKTWFKNTDRTIDSEVLDEVCQERKQTKALIGTLQVFSELNVSFRKQTHYVYLPKTYFGCFTIVRMADPKSYDSEKNIFKKKKGRFCFAHTRKIRDSYNTYLKVYKYKDLDLSSNSDLFHDS